MSSSLKPNSERHGWQISTMAPPRIKSAKISRGTSGTEAFFSCSACTEREPDRVEIEKHGHGVADLQRGTGKFEPGSATPGIPRGHVEQERMVFRAGQGAGEVVTRLPGGTEAVSPPLKRGPSRKMTIRCTGVTSLQHVGSLGLMVLSPESAAGSMARVLTLSRGHRSIARKTRRPRSAAERASEVCG